MEDKRRTAKGLAFILACKVPLAKSVMLDKTCKTYITGLGFFPLNAIAWVPCVSLHQNFRRRGGNCGVVDPKQGASATPHHTAVMFLVNVIPITSDLISECERPFLLASSEVAGK